MPDVLFAIDPGPHTGLAVKIDDAYHTATIMSQKELWDMINQFRPNKLAYEIFIGSGQRDVHINYTLELVGSLNGICHVLGITAYRQQPQARRAFIQEARALLAGLGGSGHTVHEVDALSHLLLLEYRLEHEQK
jgi:hypothetical protein